MVFDDFLSKAMRLYESEMSGRSDLDYEVNEDQMGKLMNAYEFFVELADRNGGKVDDLDLKPSYVSGGITAYFTVLYLYGDDLARFLGIANDIGSISIDSTTDGYVCISFTIPDVFRKIQK